MNIQSISIVAIFMVFFNISVTSALECPKQPEQSKKDWDTEVALAIAKIGPAKGADLKIKSKKTTQDLLGKLPKADRVYLEQMMYTSYCSALRDDKTLTESEKAKRLKIYNAEVRKTFLTAPNKEVRNKDDKKVKSLDQPMKNKESESQPSKQPESDINITGNQIKEGSIIVSKDQMGGQMAHTINNYGPPKRELSAATRAKMLEVLRSTTPSCAAFASTQGDAEAYEFKGLLMSVFREAGWDVRDMETFMFFGSKKGLVVTIPFTSPETGIAQVVAQALSHTGNSISGNRGDMANGCGVYVQVWHAQ